MAGPRLKPDFTREQQAQTRGRHLVAGVDEAGRGAWAGPVVAAAVILDPQWIPVGINDSKKLTKAQRHTLHKQLQVQSLYGVGIITAAAIDAESILIATYRAMSAALAELSPPPDHVLIDGREVALPWQPPGATIETLIGGDGLSLSIAAASIIAKETRDQLMIGYDSTYPGYGFAAHKGYGTARHRAALEQWGATALHRHSYRPIKALTNPAA